MAGLSGAKRGGKIALTRDEREYMKNLKRKNPKAYGAAVREIKRLSENGELGALGKFSLKKIVSKALKIVSPIIPIAAVGAKIMDKQVANSAKKKQTAADANARAAQAAADADAASAAGTPAEGAAKAGDAKVWVKRGLIGAGVVGGVLGLRALAKSMSRQRRRAA